MSRSNKASKKHVVSSKETQLSQDTFLGMPGSWSFPGWGAIWDNMWDTSAQARLFPPKVFGFGWSFNFGYALSMSKPVWKRLIAFFFGLVFLLLILWLLVCLGVIIYYLLTPNAPVEVVFQ